MEKHFEFFRKNIVGVNTKIQTPFNSSQKLSYADWTASGRIYGPIEDRLRKDIFPMVANTHTDTNDTGLSMTYAYHRAQQLIKGHVGASANDVLLSCSSGMTGVVNKFQRILGLKVHERFLPQLKLSEQQRPIVFITHMEHHSNQTSWLETIADVEIVPPGEDGLVSLANFEKAIKEHSHRHTKIAAITSCSNVTGLITPYMDVAALMHREGGLCFVDFACSAPYIDMNMHEDDAAGRYLDAIYFSPHKFLGGPGSTGILIFNQNLYSNKIPDNPGGGTVDWTNPWGGHKFVDDIEAREDGGTPAFLQTIKVALCIKLKEAMGVENMHKREAEILSLVWPALDAIPNLHVLAAEHRQRLGVISFYIDDLHYNVGVKMLNDRFGIQTRGGCSCAGTYGHYLLNVSPSQSEEITSLISSGNCSTKPGWIRMSIHPTQSNSEVSYILKAIKQLAENHREWAKEYEVDLIQGRIKPKENDTTTAMEAMIDDCLERDFGSLSQAL